MGAKAERGKRRRIKLVGGGYRYSRQSSSNPGGSAKSIRRAARKAAKKETNRVVRKQKLAAIRRHAKERVRELFLAKNSRNGGAD